MSMNWRDVSCVIDRAEGLGIVEQSQRLRTKWFSGNAHLRKLDWRHLLSLSDLQFRNELINILSNKTEETGQ